MDFERIKNLILWKGCEITDGLTQMEFQRIEELYKIRFPPDLKNFLANYLPIKNGFINWRDENPANRKSIEDSLNWPLEGMIFDIEQNNFWYEKWGPKPSMLNEAIEKCKEMFQSVPKLIPIYSHRYIPMDPLEAGNPIFSVYQTDIILYGINLEIYLFNEFGHDEHAPVSGALEKKIRFWSDLVDG